MSDPARILHISDIHCTSPHPCGTTAQIIDAIHTVTKSAKIDSIVAAGDFTFKGSNAGFDEARHLLTRVAQATGIDRKDIILCPGNHDLQMEKKHAALFSYEKFASALTGDSSCCFGGKSTLFKRTSIADYWIFNSVFTLDHRFGKVDPVEFRELITGTTTDKPRVCVIHHHVINQFTEDISVLRNAYELLELLDEFKFHLVLHGHQHSRQTMPLGNSKFISFGVRPLSFRDAGANCGFALIELSGAPRSISIRDFILDPSGENLKALELN